MSGEAGIGKTTLAEGLCEEARAYDAVMLTGRCYDLTETPPYGPWVELFGQYQATHELPPPAAFAEHGTIGAVTSQAVLFQQVLDFLKSLAAHRPVVLLLDDLHWADPASLDLLRVLARTAPMLPLLIVVTYRVEEIIRGHPLYALLPTLVREAHATRLDLHPLTEDDVRALIGAQYRLRPADAARLITYLQERAEGNPFFLGELLRTLEEEGALHRASDGWAVGDLEQMRLPALLRQVIDGRLARLGEDAQTLLGVASVIGQEVPFGLWAVVTGRDDERLLDVVEQATVSRIVEATVDGMGFRFVHALIRKALYEGVLPLRRRVLHQRTGEALAALPSADADAVASHFQRAGDRRAAAWLVQAGERAQHAHAVLTAVDRYEAALALMERGDAVAAARGWLLIRIAVLLRFTDIPRCLEHLDEARAIAATVSDRALAAITRFLHAFLYLNHDKHQETLPELAAAVEALEALMAEEYTRLNEQEGLDNAAGRTWRGSLIYQFALVGRSADAFAMGERFVAEIAPPTAGGLQRGFTYGGAYTGLGIAHALRGHPGAAREAFARAAEVFRLAGAHSNASQAVYWDLELGMLPFQTDRVAERRERVAEAERELQQASPSMADLLRPWEFSSLLLVEGDWAAVEASARANRARRTGERRRMANCLLGPLMHARGESALAWAEVRDMLPDGPATAPGDGTFYQVVQMQRLAVILALDAEDMQTARQWLEAYDRWLEWNGAVLGQSERHALWARYYRQLDDREQASVHAECALACAGDPRQPLALLAAHRLLGELDIDARRFETAREHLNTSLALADACAAPYERALTLLAVAKLHMVAGQKADIVSVLTDVRAICAPLGAKPALARADALAARISGSHDTPSIYPDGLSAREIEILRLLAAGSSNQQIADILSISVRTVERHITNLYSKIGAHGRADATAYALRYLP
jgi:DNA-binding CsgD family transcriptional regulator/tetratricopeptide (TPR) repeat protein